MCAATELRLHADHQIEQLFPLNDLGDRLPAHCGRNYSFYICNVDPIPCDLVPIDVDQQTRLAKFSHNREIGKPWHLGKYVLDLDRFVLKHVQIFPVYFDRQRTLETSQGLVHGILGGLGIVENDSGKGSEFLVDRFDELFFLADFAGPYFVFVWLEANVELAVKEAGGISAIVGTS